MNEASIRSLSKTLAVSPKVVALVAGTSQALDLSVLLGAAWGDGNTITLECDQAFGYRLGNEAGDADLAVVDPDPDQCKRVPAGVEERGLVPRGAGPFLMVVSASNARLSITVSSAATF